MTNNKLLILHWFDSERPGAPLYLIDILPLPDHDYCVSSGQRNVLYCTANVKVWFLSLNTILAVVITLYLYKLY